MQQSAGVRDGILRFYDRFSGGEAAGFAEVIAQVEGVSVIGTGPDEGHDDRDDWIATYEQMMRDEMAGTRVGGRRAALRLPRWKPAADPPDRRPA